LTPISDFQSTGSGGEHSGPGNNEKAVRVLPTASLSFGRGWRPRPESFHFFCLRIKPNVQAVGRARGRGTTEVSQEPKAEPIPDPQISSSPAILYIKTLLFSLSRICFPPKIVLTFPLFPLKYIIVYCCQSLTSVSAEGVIIIKSPKDNSQRMSKDAFFRGY